jgi:hypothetical protein
MRVSTISSMSRFNSRGSQAIPRSRCQKFSLHHQAALASSGGFAAATASGNRIALTNDPGICRINFIRTRQTNSALM